MLKKGVVLGFIYVLLIILREYSYLFGNFGFILFLIKIFNEGYEVGNYFLIKRRKRFFV